MFKKIFLGTTKFGGTKNWGTTAPNGPRGYGMSINSKNRICKIPNYALHNTMLNK